MYDKELGVRDGARNWGLLAQSRLKAEAQSLSEASVRPDLSP